MVVALSVAGSDSIGGAGIQADIKAMAAVGVHAATAITCVTSQNTRKVKAILPLPVEQVESQLAAVLADADVKAIKTGMLYNAEIASAVSSRLESVKAPIVVDPVLVAGVGDTLHAEDLLEALRSRLLPLATLITPNVPEAEELTDLSIKDLQGARRACKVIADFGPKGVLLKGGHLPGGNATDVLYHEGRFVELRQTRIDAKVHGSGCNLSAFIAAYLALGLELEEAVVQGKARITEGIESHYPVGKGLDVCDSLASVRREQARYSVMVELAESVRELETILTREWVPEVGTNFAYALPHARYYEDVCALEGRIVGAGKRVARTGCLSFGASRHVARIVLTAMSFDPECRSAINVRCSDENIGALKKAKLKISSFDRADEPEGVKTMEWGTAEAIRSAGRVPDAIFDRGGLGKEPMIRLLGKDPRDVLSKLSRAMR
ncbi:MAG TPA: bifunctional hydroxymethylpyrimidine kinase/phosphomethylpyrimidine kinase [Methanomassiliicoccales archaeon]|nr:bifunctional hydroxymethylpyrimidine kinase/phosphomethylpyrimidine kinase [Methanomassiliicoccales archaeon]